MGVNPRGMRMRLKLTSASKTLPDGTLGTAAFTLESWE